MDSSYGEISKVATGLSNQDDLKELFYPLVAFFNELAPSEEQIAEFKAASINPSFDTAIYQIIVNFNK